MKRVFIAALLLSGAFAAVAQKNFIDQNYIEVSGYNKMEVEPNMIFINFQIKETDTKGRVSVAQMEHNIIRELEKAGIDVGKQLTINDMTSEFVKYILRRQEIMQSKSYTVEVSSAAQAGKVFVALENAGLSNATIGRVDHSAIDSLRLVSKVEAVKAAKVKADALAKAVNRKTGNAIYIQDVERIFRAFSGNIMAKAVSYDSVEESMPSIEFQKIPVESNVTVYFSLE